MERVIATKIGILSVAIFFIANLNSCGDNKYKAKNAEDIETINSGKIAYAIDESIWDIIKPATEMYLEKYENVILYDTVVTARAAMKELLAGNRRVAIIARDYLPDESDLMAQKGMEPHQRLKAADDALVFCVNEEFPVIFTQDSILKAVFQEGASLGDFHEKIDFKENYYIKGRNHSEYSNFENFLLEYKDLKVNLNIEKNTKEILEKVSDDISNIGIVYLSQVANADTSLKIKMLPVGFIDSTGEYSRAAPVHQSYVVQGRYPYTIGWYLYMLEDRQNLPFWFSKYIAQENKVQAYFKDKGIVPAFARFKLRREN